MVFGMHVPSEPSTGTTVPVDAPNLSPFLGAKDQPLRLSDLYHKFVHPTYSICDLDRACIAVPPPSNRSDLLYHR